MSMEAKILVANRGEIACRIIRSCHALEMRTVAVFSDADANSAHVAQADEAVRIGPARASESYLDARRIIAAAHETGAHAVHPGYGFLAENSDFARSVVDAGLVWVGPSPEVIHTMGDKQRARAVAASADVPILSGTDELLAVGSSALPELAARIGYPLLVKASAGGGGIGMKRVDTPDALADVVASTQAMADKAFGHRGVYLEPLITSARHIEVQVFGFGDGRGVHLYDRDCSVQRRFQKVIEEAPAPKLSDHVRRRLFASSLALVAHTRYSGAGTVEFIYDPAREQAYFLEMNTRIQVEHPVTEMITGVDLVAWQLLHALGALTTPEQREIQATGHALECRLYAERPEKRFLPAPGPIDAIRWPEEHAALRIDTGVRAGDKVTPYYDPLVAKLASHGAGRDEAIANMREALAELRIEGLSTNQQLLSEVLEHPAFLAGGVATDYLEAYVSKR